MIATVQFIVPVRLGRDEPPIDFIPHNNGQCAETGWWVDHRRDLGVLVCTNRDRSPKLRMHVPLSNCILTFDERPEEWP